MWDVLNQLQQEGRLADLRRERIGHTVRGFVAACSAELVVVSVVNDECHFDGTTVLRVEDVTFVRSGNEVLQAWTRVLQESPSSPASVKHVDLASWESVVRAVAGHEPVVTFHREHADDSVCHIGANVTIAGTCVVADEVTVEGTIDGRFALELDDLTKVDFGGGYEQALWRMIQARE